MDKLDKVTLAFLAALVVWALFLVVKQSQIHLPEKKMPGGRIESGVYANPEFDKKIDTAKKLLNAGNLELAEPLIKSLIADFPYEGTPHFLYADFFIRRQQPVAAMHEHRLSIELNPDFLDKKTTLFQGKIIKRNIEEALIVINNALLENPTDETVLENKKNYNYLKRRIAGSCS